MDEDYRVFSPHQNMLLGIAIGDAWGAGYEFRFKELRSYQDIGLEKYIKSAFTDSDHVPGMYTDDTQMSIAVAELLASDKEFSRENLADKFVECYKRNPIIGYAKNFQKFLDSIGSGKEFIERINPDSIRNGAAMRAVPIGVVYNPNHVVEYAKINASLTHNTPKGIASSVAVATISHIKFYEDYRYEGSMDQIMANLYAYIRPIDVESWEYFDRVSEMDKFNPELLFGKEHAAKGVPCDGMRTVGALIYLMSHRNFQSPNSILLDSAHLGGDVDSVASISLGIGLMHGHVSDIPKFLLKGLTNHEYGADYLCSLGDRLGKKFPVPNKNL